MDNVRRKLKRDLALGKGIRATELYNFAKERGVSKSQVKDLLEENYGYKINKSYNGDRNPRRDYMTVRITSLGFTQIG